LRFVFVGRYEKLKGIEELHKVIKETIDNLEYEIQFIGPIPLEKQLRHTRINYMGLVRDSEIIRTELQKADILVCASYSEGMPSAILEAMACSCAIIATDVGAVNTMLDHQNGWLIKGDIISGLQYAIKEAVNLPKHQMELMKSVSVSRVSEHFTWTKIMEKTIIEIKNLNT
jgi:glycosyltransferase involved in cell wall biosynthesis